MEQISKFIAGKSFCPFGDAAVWGLQSNLAKYRGEFIELIDRTNPEDIGPAVPIRPIYRPDESMPSGLRDSTLQPVGNSPLIRRFRYLISPSVISVSSDARNPETARSVVVLPAPLVPTNATIDPSGTSSDTPWIAVATR